MTILGQLDYEENGTWDAFPREEASSRLSRGHRSKGQLSSSALAGPARPATRLFSALDPTSATCADP